MSGRAMTKLLVNISADMSGYRHTELVAEYLYISVSKIGRMETWTAKSSSSPAHLAINTVH